MADTTIYSFAIAIEAIGHNRLRSLLTSLGIIFGVASVIAMLAVGEGARQEIISQMKLLGANNVIVRPIVEQEEGQVESTSDTREERRPFSTGLTLMDAESIKETIPGVLAVSPEIVAETQAVRSGFRRSSKLVGVTNDYFLNGDFELLEGAYFTDEQLASAAPVAVIGYDVQTRFFTSEPAIGSRIKCGNLWLTVVGVLRQRAISESSMDALGIRNYNNDIYTPLSTMRLRYENRTQLTVADVQGAQGGDDEDAPAAAGPMQHELDQLVVRVSGSEMVAPVADIVNRMLERRHSGVVDYEVIIPEQLLEQERRAQAIFNAVLAAIASISLVVGGIGIMNIMLASIMERIREIGVRRAVGATRKDIILQFLIEAVMVSFIGGIVGVILGFALSLGIERMAGIETVVSPMSIALAFLVSVSVGLIFGLLPAKRAAEHDPVVALRHE
jgi:putative ABC transport system permease protein